MDETREIDIDLRKIIYMMRSKVIFILLITIAFGAAAGLYTHFFIDPVYSTSCSMCVNSNPNRTSEGYVSPSDISASSSLVQTYMEALISDKVLDPVAAELHLGSGSDIRGSISASQKGDTWIFRITVKNKDPQMAADIANAICKVAPAEMVKVVKAGSVSVLDTAKVPYSPSSPNTKKNILTGLAIGFALSFVAFFIYEMFDTSITNAKDLERDFEIPVLGTVPLLDEVERGSLSNESSNEIAPPEPSVSAPKPSAALLENIQSMKGDAKND